MNQSDIPTRFNIPFANEAGTGYIRAIPQATQTPTTTDAPASLTQGFPPVTFLPEASGGIPPSGMDFNGILNEITAQLRWHAAGGLAVYDATFSAAVSGYPKGAMLASSVTSGLVWVSTAEGNTTNPDSTSATNWLKVGGTSLTFDSSNNWMRMSADGWTEMGGIYTPVTSQSSITLTFPFGGFPTACLGVEAIVRNTTASGNCDIWMQEVSLSQTQAIMIPQAAVSSPVYPGGGFRWKAYGY